MEGNPVQRKSQFGLVTAIVLLVMLAAQLQFTGCASSGTTKQANPEREQAIKDSLLNLQKIELYKLWSTGYEAAKQNNYPKAIRYYRQVIEKDTIGVYGSIKYERIAAAYLQTQSSDSAEYFLQEGMKLAPEKPYYYNTLGYLYNVSRRFEEAAEMYNKLIELEPDNAEHYEKLGDVYIALNDVPNATTALQKVIELQPNNKAVQEKLSGLLVSSGDAEQVIAAQKRMIELEPNNMQRHIDLAKTYHNETRFDDAAEELKIVIAAEPQNVYALELLGDCYNNLEQYNEAVTTYKRILEVNAEDKKNMCNLANAYTNLGRYAMAISQANKAIKLDGSYGLAWLSIGFAYQTSAERCVAKRNGEIKYEDKLVYKMAYENFGMALKDNLSRNDAQRYRDFLSPLIPTPQDDFMNKGKTIQGEECYNWIQ